MARRRQSDPDAELRKKYGGTGKVQEHLKPDYAGTPPKDTAHDTFKKLMSGEKSAAQWKHEIDESKMKLRADVGKKKIRDDLAQQTAFGRNRGTRRR
jgi:hypothetical protein